MDQAQQPPPPAVLPPPGGRPCYHFYPFLAVCREVNVIAQVPRQIISDITDIAAWLHC
jgi:hypothetical protein